MHELNWLNGIHFRKCIMYAFINMESKGLQPKHSAGANGEGHTLGENAQFPPEGSFLNPMELRHKCGNSLVNSAQTPQPTS